MTGTRWYQVLGDQVPAYHLPGGQVSGDCHSLPGAWFQYLVTGDWLLQYLVPGAFDCLVSGEVDCLMPGDW